MYSVAESEAKVVHKEPLFFMKIIFCYCFRSRNTNRAEYHIGMHTDRAATYGCKISQLYEANV